MTVSSGWGVQELMFCQHRPRLNKARAHVKREKVGRKESETCRAKVRAGDAHSCDLAASFCTAPVFKDRIGVAANPLCFGAPCKSRLCSLSWYTAYIDDTALAQKAWYGEYGEQRTSWGYCHD